MLMEAAGEKFFENLKNRLDSHDKLWYPVVTARLVKPNQSSSDSLQRDACNSLWGDSVPPFHSPIYWKEKAAYGLLRFPCAQRGALWYGALCQKEQNAGHTDLTTCAPRFLYCKGRGRTSAELSLDTPGECTIIRCVGKTRKVVFLRNDKMGGNEWKN